MTQRVRIASWNLCGKGGPTAASLGALLSEKGGADLVLLQEVSHGGLPKFCEAAGLNWWIHARAEFWDLLRARGRVGGRSPDGSIRGVPRCVAIAGRGLPMRGATAFPYVPLPEKVMAGWLDIGGVPTTVVSYHAPTGVQHGLKKPEQAVRIARWLAEVDGPVIVAGDFNTPLVDPPDFDEVRTHSPTGLPDLMGAPGDDLLVGARPGHTLRDALRTYFENHPGKLAAVCAERPQGPLTTSYCTDKQGQNRYRYDAVWLSPHFDVVNVEYFYDDAIKDDMTDHALVLVDAVLRHEPSDSGMGNQRAADGN